MEKHQYQDANTKDFAHDNYTLLDKIGEGGYGLVYEAKQKSTGQLVAIKTLKLREITDPQKRQNQIARFEREVQLCARISHPNIVKLIDKGDSNDGEPYAVFEYVTGSTLKQYIGSQKGLSAVETKHLMMQVLDALVSAHANGIIHRDLKPQNIMVTNIDSRPHVKVLDFGIGTISHEFRPQAYQTLTLTREFVGTPSYSAPEQLRGEPPTELSDLYAWGLITIECLTGKPVIKGKSVAEVFQQQLQPSSVTIPPAILAHPLGDLLRRVLNKNPQQRSASAKIILEEVERINFNSLIGVIQPAVGQGSYEEDEDALTIENSLLSTSASAKRKQITVLCVKLNLLMAPNSQLDLETLDAIEKDQLNTCKDIAIKYGGFVVGNISNNIVIYFGYPDSYDTDARRAGRTALELIAETRKRSALLQEMHGVSISLRTALHSGMVLILPNQVPEGNVPNIAFDLLYQAKPGTALVSHTSQKLLEPYLDFEFAKEVKFPNEILPLPTYLLLGERQTEALSTLRSWSANRDMIGRDMEQTKILQAWDAAKTSLQTILIVGQAGIGKSRLIHDVKQHVQADEHTFRECRCLPENQNSALQPVLNMFKRHWGVAALEQQDQIHQRLTEALKAAEVTTEESFEILCSWLSLPIPEGFTFSQKSPEEQKRILFQTLKQCIQHIDPQKRFLLVFEDLHWIDPTSKEFLHFLQEDNNQQYMLLMTTRPPQEDLGFKNVIGIELNSLPNSAIDLMIKSVLGNEEVSPAVIEYISERTDGIPLFVEELTSMLIDQNYLILQNESYELINDIEEKAIPSTLQDLLNARLDALGAAKETAQIASAIGREFDYEVLIKASIRDEAMIQHDLEQLIKADLIFRHRRVNEDRYIFRHALISDAAYSEMTNTRKKEVHGRLAYILEHDFPAKILENPFQLADHHARASNYPKAREYGLMAAGKALEKSLNEEVLSVSQQVIKWIEQENNEEALVDKLTIYCTQTNALMTKYGWSAKPAKSSVDKAFNLLQQLGEQEVATRNLISSYWILYIYYHTSSQRDKTKEVSKKLLELAQNDQSETLTVSSKVLEGIRMYVDGEFEASIDLLENTIDHAIAVEHTEVNLVIGIDNLAYAACSLGQYLWLHGRHEDGRKRGDWAIERAREINHIPSLCLSLMFRCIVHQLDGEKEQVKVLIGETLQYAFEYGLGAFIPYASTLKHWAYDEVEPVDQMIGQLKAIGCELGLSYYWSLPAEYEYNSGQKKEALQRVENCLKLCETNKEYYFQEHLLKMKDTFSK